MHFLSQDYRSRDGQGGTTLYPCPFNARCECAVKFRVVWQEEDWTLQCQGKHTPESHAKDNVSRGFALQERAAIQQVVRANPLASSTEVRRNLDLQEKAVYISQAKSSAVARLTTQKRAEVMERYTGGKEVNDTLGVLTCVCKDIYLVDLIE
jgi:hypothetical protein